MMDPVVADAERANLAFLVNSQHGVRRQTASLKYFLRLDECSPCPAPGFFPTVRCVDEIQVYVVQPRLGEARLDRFLQCGQSAAPSSSMSRTTSLGILISHVPGRYLGGEEDVGARRARFPHESSDGIRARLFVAVCASGIDMSVASGKGVASDGFTLGGGTVVVILSMWAWTCGMAEGRGSCQDMHGSHSRLIDLIE